MESLSGCAPSGETINPEELPEEPADSPAAPRAVPSPGLPVSEEEYKRMKEAAKHSPAPRVKNAQEDRAKK